MPIPPLSHGVARTLSEHHKEIDSLSYTTSVLFLIAILVTTAAFLVILSTGIYSHVTKRAFYKPLLLPTLVPMACTTPLFILGTIRQRELSAKREQLFTIMHEELALHKKLSVKKLILFIEKYLLEDSHNPKVFWHRIYKDHLITQLETRNTAAQNGLKRAVNSAAEQKKIEDDHNNIKKALASAKKHLTKDLEKMAESS